ncbi:hypothetical protein ACQUJS_02095 [Ralstonia pseudosolanacearum]|uniref:YkuD domain-containing protein n=1 Tax=Ralstonia solanacearum TaxID=305 RepID=A0A0S4TLN0_RALSL|nr:protein of unknown function [Ralstonia solanacearum]
MDKTPLSFFQQAIPDLFKADTNADIGNIFIALVYPHIQIIAYPETVWIGCQQSNVSIEPDAYPLLKFLEEFPYNGSNPHPESGTNGPYGSHGILVFNVPGRTGMGLHSGRANSGAQNHPTLGCIRTTDAAMGFVRNLITTDPVTSMTVINNNINAPQFGTQQ